MLQRTRRKELVLITGVHGFLGQHVVRLFLDESKCDLVLTAREEATLFADAADLPRIHAYHQMDATNRIRVREVIQSVKPDVIVNCAGFRNVDRAEHERELTWKTNVSAVEYLAESARKVDARIVHVSTDYVFDGMKVPYAEGDAPHPLNYYGRTKLASENALKTSGVPHTIIRTSLMYGSSESLNTNEALIIAQKLERKEMVELATDLSSSPTLVNDVALAIVRATERSKFGLYHVAAHEMLSRYEFGLRVAQAFGLDTSLITGKLDSEIVYPFERAERPMRSALVSLKAQTDLGLRLSNVDEGLQVTVRGIQEISGEDFDQHIYE
jgi:dTDP-4-dehydrorhamnose reductase